MQSPGPCAPPRARFVPPQPRAPATLRRRKRRPTKHSGGGKGGKLKSKLQKVLDGKKVEIASPIEAIAAALSAPFVRPAASKELRTGVARAAVHFLKGMSPRDVSKRPFAVFTPPFTPPPWPLPSIW